MTQKNMKTRAGPRLTCAQWCPEEAGSGTSRQRLTGDGWGELMRDTTLVLFLRKRLSRQRSEAGLKNHLHRTSVKFKKSQLSTGRWNLCISQCLVLKCCHIADKGRGPGKPPILHQKQSLEKEMQEEQGNGCSLAPFPSHYTTA